VYLYCYLPVRGAYVSLQLAKMSNIRVFVLLCALFVLYSVIYVILYHSGKLRVHAYGDHAYLVTSNYLSRQSLAKMSNIRVLYCFLYSVFLRISYRRLGVHTGPAAYLIHSCNCICCVRELRFLAGRNQSSNFGYDANPRSWNGAGRF
jgi:hypothetical protein